MKIHIQLISDDGRLISTTDTELPEIAHQVVDRMENLMYDEETLHKCGECNKFSCSLCEDEAHERMQDLQEIMATGN